VDDEEGLCEIEGDVNLNVIERNHLVIAIQYQLEAKLFLKSLLTIAKYKLLFVCNYFIACVIKFW